MLSRGETLAARWFHEPQPISDQLVGLGFPHRAVRYRPGGSSFSSPVCWRCRDVEGFLIWGWELILPELGETSVLDRGATLAARWLLEPQPISNHPVGLGFHTARGGIDPGDLSFCPRVVGVVEVWRGLPSGDKT